MEQNVYRSIEPRATPVAESAVFLIPNYDYFHRQIIGFPELADAAPEWLDYNVRNLEATALMFPKYCEKRHLFQESKVLRVGDPSEIPANVDTATDVVIRYSYGWDGVHISIEKNGLREETERPWFHNPDLEDSERSKLEALEDLLQS